MTIKVQRVPRELLALLGVVGDNPPASLLEDYRATIEMANLILAQIPIEQEFTNNAAAADGSTAVVTVPQGQVWFVDGVQTSVIANPATNSVRTETYWSGGLLTQQNLISGTTVPGGAIVSYTDGWVSASGFQLVAKAGEDFTSRMVRNSGAALNMTCLVRFRRIRT